MVGTELKKGLQLQETRMYQLSVVCNTAFILQVELQIFKQPCLVGQIP